MKLSEGQQKPLWRAIAAAWAAHCRQTGERVSDSKAKEKWRHEVVLRETGFRSITEIPRAGGHFAKLMAALEQISGDGIRWTMALHGAEKRPYIHGIQTLINTHELPDEYVAEIATCVTKAELVPLGDMPVEHLAALLGALKRTCNTRLTREVEA